MSRTERAGAIRDPAAAAAIAAAAVAAAATAVVVAEVKRKRAGANTFEAVPIMSKSTSWRR